MDKAFVRLLTKLFIYHSDLRHNIQLLMELGIH